MGVPRWTWLVTLPTVLAIGVATALSLGREPLGDTVVYGLGTLALAVGGALVLRQEHGHLVGVLMVWLGLDLAAAELVEGLGLVAPQLTAASAWVLSWHGPLGVTGYLVLLLVFPTGRAPDPRWRPLLVATVASGLVLVVGTAADLTWLAATGGAALTAATVGVLASLVVRYRTAGPVVRRQLRVLAVVGAAFAAYVPVGLAFYGEHPVATALGDLPVVLVPTAICLAILRHHLYDAEARVDAYLLDLRGGRAEPEDLIGLLRELLERPDLELRLLPPGAEPDASATTIVHRGTPLAEVTHEGAAPARLADLLARSVLALELGRLRWALQAQLDEVQASRRRIVEAGYAERRRLERDLHDGAQQRLLSVGVALRRTQHQLGEHPASEVIQGVVDELASALVELRQLAHGIRPNSLDQGLSIALRELAGRTPIPVTLDVPQQRLDPEIETTAYFVVSEAIANAVKHAGASRVDLALQVEDGYAVVTVADDGRGGANPAGRGLAGLADRVAAHGGTLVVTSDRSQGTTIRAEIACG